ncbi:unnamed protein product, partial [marine sediment metagenome]
MGALLMAIAVTFQAGCAQSQTSTVQVTSYEDGEVLRYPVILLKGTVADKALTSITAVNESSSRDTRELNGLVHEGQFKVLADLVPGTNRIVLRTGKSETRITLEYKPQTNPYKVRVFYFVGKDGDTRYQTPLPDDNYDFRGKLGTALTLMQTYTAEEMHRLGYGRRTFNTELDEDGKVIVHLLKGPLPAEEYWKPDGVNGGALYGQISRTLSKVAPEPNTRNLVIVGLSRFDP